MARENKPLGVTLACALFLAVAAGCGKQQIAQIPATPQPPAPQAADPKPISPITNTNSPLHGWKKFSSAEGKFSVIFPSRPIEDDKTEQGKDGEIHIHSFLAPKDLQNRYRVDYYDLPRLNDPKMMLARMEQSLVTRENAKIVSYKQLQVGGHYATDFEFVPGSHPDYSGRVRLIAVGQRAYSLIAIYLTAQPHPDETDGFFNSFTLQN